MVRCCAPGCSNDSLQKEKNLSFYKFPENADLKQEWVKNMGRVARGVKSSAGSHKLFEPLQSDRLRSSHFEEDQFERNFMAEFVATGEMTSRRLKPEAVPTKFSHREAVAEKKPRRESQYLKRKYDQSQEEVRQAPS